MASKEKASYVPQGFPSDLPRMNPVALDSTPNGQTQVTKKMNGVTITTQMASAPKQETEAERNARATSTKEIEGKKGKNKMTVRTF